MHKLLLAASAALFTIGSAQAAEVIQTSDQLKNATIGFGAINTTTTTTNADGRTTTSTGTVRYSDGTAPKDVWQQQNVGGAGVTGITTTYARSGNGSAYFSGVDSSSKADLEILFSKAVPLSEVTSLSYDAFRDGSSKVAGHFINSLRLIMGNADGTAVGTYLIYEPVYNGYPTNNPIAADVWNTLSITGASTMWANNDRLVEPANTQPCRDCFASFDAWKASNPTLTVIGLSTGSGSGFSSTKPDIPSTYAGAVDNITLSTTSASTTWNFEVATSAVPEPASWALMIGGVGLTGGVLRRRRGAALATA